MPGHIPFFHSAFVSIRIKTDMKEDKNKATEKCKFVTLNFAGLWKQVAELCFSFFFGLPQPSPRH